VFSNLNLHPFKDKKTIRSILEKNSTNSFDHSEEQTKFTFYHSLGCFLFEFACVC